jgi:hypothetical protein
MNLIKRIRPFGDNEGTADAEHMMRTWYCSYRIVRSRHMVMALNEETLLPVVAPLTSMTKTAGPTLQRLVHAGLYSFGILGEIIDRECAAMGAWRTADTQPIARNSDPYFQFRSCYEIHYSHLGRPVLCNSVPH